MSRSERPFLKEALKKGHSIHFDAQGRATRAYTRICCGRRMWKKADLPRHNELFHKKESPS